jgi:hypothetical protein
MVFAVQCPNPRCRKFMLVQERDRERQIVCLLCKTPFRIGSEPSPPVEKTDHEDRASGTE